MVEVTHIVGAAEAVLAATVGHVPGVIAGVTTALWSTVLSPQFSERLPQLQSVAGPTASVLATFTYILLAVRLVTILPDSRYATFPGDIAHPSGCTRVAEDRPHRSYGMAPPKFKMSVTEVQDKAREWILAQPHAKIFRDEPGDIYAQAYSTLFGFPDNFAVKIFTNSQRQTEVWVQSELRVGEGDLEVNLKRVQNFLKYLNSECE